MLLYVIICYYMLLYVIICYYMLLYVIISYNTVYYLNPNKIITLKLIRYNITPMLKNLT